MGRKHICSLTKQIEDVLVKKTAFGTSKYTDKKYNRNKDKIYSVSTLKTYLKHCNYFSDFCKKNYNCKTIVQCRKYVDDFLKTRIEEDKSPYTQKLEASALAKLYNCSTSDFIETESRSRADITRSRGDKMRDSHFSESRNEKLIEFCKSTGLRRNELENLRGDCLIQMKGKYYINVVKGAKGGKERTVEVIGNIGNVTRLMKDAGSGKVFPKVHNAADIHGYRSQYATKLYKMLARRKDRIPKNDKYICRKELKGTIYDKRAMSIVSENLGHNRISVIAQSYLRSSDK